MKPAGKKWLVKNKDGLIRGPFSTESILRKIGRGEISGDEQVALYPGAQWISITQDPQFYDRLLEVLTHSKDEFDTELTQPGTIDNKSSTSKSVDFGASGRGRAVDISTEDTKTAHRPTSGESTPINDVGEFQKTTRQDGEEEEEDQFQFSKTTKSNRTRKSKKEEDDEKGEVIELLSLDKVLKKEMLKKAPLPILVAAVILVIGIYLLFGGDGEDGDRIHLLAPHKTENRLPQNQLVTKIRRGFAYFYRDTYPDYLKAQDEFVQAVEGAPESQEALAGLCQVYYELWPFTYQDSADLRTIKSVSLLAAKVAPTGLASGTCRLVDLMVRGRYMEAKSLSESILDAFGNNLTEPPVAVYYFKSRLLEFTQEYSTALGYVTSAEQLRPEWIAPFVLEADLLVKVNDPSAAAKRLQQVLKANPNHQVAKIKLGLIEYKHFNHLDRARDFLESAVEHEEEVPRPILSQGYFGLAEISLQRSEEAQALKYAQQAYSLNPSNTGSKNLIVKLGGVERLKKTKVKGQQLIYEGDQFVREGDCNAAQAHYKAAYEMNKKNGIAAMKAAKCLWELSFTTEAIEWLNRAIRADSKLIEAYVLLADYYTQRYNFMAAAQTLAKAQTLAPKSYDVYRGYALVEMRRKNPEGAVTYAKKAISIYEADVETYIIMAQGYLELANYREAYSAAAKAVEIDLNHRQAQIVYARALAGIRGVDAGLAHLVEIVNRYPLITEYRLALGQIMMEDERYNDAEKVFRQIIEIEEKPKRAWLELGRALRALGKLEPALEAFLKAAVLDPADVEALFETGMLYLEVKKPDAAKTNFQRVLRINPSYPLVHYYLGRAAIMMNNPQEALSEAEEERRINPNLAEAYLLSAEAYTMLQQYRLCAREYQKAIQLRPQGAAIYVKIAKCYRLSGNLDVAVSMLSQAAAKESGFAEIYKEQGLVYEMRGDTELAIEAYNQYFTLDPNNPDVPQIRQRIEELQRKSSF